MKQIVDGIVTFVCAAMVIAIVIYSYKLNRDENFVKKASTAQGEVVAYNAGIILINFDIPVINECGDTEIVGYITTPSNLPVQLKPMLIPEAKAADLVSEKGQVLVFPVLDVLPFLTEEGTYIIELFLSNTCGITDKSVQLPMISMVIGGAGV